MSWKVADAKQRFSELLRRAARAPQLIRNRDQVVAVVMSPVAAEAALKRSAPTMRDALADLRRIAAETDYQLELPARTDRAVTFDWPLDVPRRHKRSQRAR